MHSFLRNADGSYTVGIWLAQNGDMTLWRMFDVPDLSNAMRAVSMLNGGGTPLINIAITKEH